MPPRRASSFPVMKEAEGIVYIGGRYYAETEARISVFDRGFLYGDAVFETLRAYGGTIFLARRHVSRLFRSAELIGLKVPFSRGEMLGVLERVLKRSGIGDAYMRVSVTRGAGAPGPVPDPAAAPSVVVICRPVKPPPARAYERGVAVVTSRFRKAPPESFDSRIKSHSYLPNQLARMEAARAGAFECLMLDHRGRLAEGAMSNVFIVRGGTVLTPRSTGAILEGTRRELALRLARRLGIPAREDDVPSGAAARADECFITSAVCEMLPVVRIDGRRVGGGAPGEVTRRLHAEMRKEISRRCGTERD
ncbi:MAG: aminotransferase class IV [bacterium]